MQTSLFLARLIGPILIAMGAGMLLNPRVYRAMADEFVRSRALIYLSGLLAITGGLALVLSHNVWAADWRVILTLLGWLAAIGGAVRIVAPDQVVRIARAVFDRPMVITAAGGVIAALGLLLCFFGYFR